MAALDQPRIEELIGSYESTAVTDELYDMGKLLLDDCVQRVQHLDSKAVTIGGYTGAIIALMVSTFSIWTIGIDRWAILFVGLGSLAGLASGAAALASTWPQKVLLPSDSDWFEQDGFTDPDRLKRYYVASMHLSITSHEKTNAQKVSRIKYAQTCLAIMVLFLLIVLGDATYRVMTRPSRLSSDPAALVVSSDRQVSSEDAAALVSWGSQRP